LSKYRKPERVGADIYYAAGFTKLICISHFDDLLTHHLPDKYLDFGDSDDVIRKNIEWLLTKTIEMKSISGIVYCFKAALEQWCNCLFYQNGTIGKLRRESQDCIRNICKIRKVFK
jgi:hypothetical protein